MKTRERENLTKNLPKGRNWRSRGFFRFKSFLKKRVFVKGELPREKAVQKKSERPTKKGE